MIKTKPASKEYRKNFDNVFKKKKLSKQELESMIEKSNRKANDRPHKLR